ncbi:probable blue pigment (indigoidine) exporter [Mesorhizobium albiziae]|uniref:Probable blue pigment (Indigoidine) exporter n=1 Tax=Neomesorhizobium albiziae TaxID=335020 RepID=A0A1I4C6H3_9HYPH|nr:EamA family transporter [Mesorhizobium albiziae]GLS29411.1 ABC transporter permease [Mesorhizobium albiziae]SFK75987.1 probable blue pigment (indigoidine) exporter [Mesorhizobium albiziae]
MTSRFADVLAAAVAPAIWGTTYIVTTEFLPPDRPLTVAMLRALPAGLLLLAAVGSMPSGKWWGRVFLLGALNFSIFWYLLFVAAYRLPGGVAATIGAMQPLFVLVLARFMIGTPVRLVAVVAALAGVLGVAMLILQPNARLDPLGLIAGLGSAVSLAAGLVLSKRWQAPVSALTFSAWQLTAGGLLLLPVALMMEPALPIPSAKNLVGFIWLAVPGAALTYIVWFRGIARLGPAAVAPLGLLSPVVAVMIGWIVLGQSLGALQLAGMTIVLLSVWAGQKVPQAAQVPRPSSMRDRISRKLSTSNLERKET